jgi:5'-methylthioadenosine phosphorylase
MSNHITLGVIGGSGLYHMAGLTNIEERPVTTPFGAPSDPLVLGSLNGQRVAFLARHGRGHRINPSEVNYRANIYAFKALGVTRIVSVSACGSLRDDYAPGHIVIPDQIFDNTRGRARTFFGDGLVAHVGVADPFCPQLSPLLAQATRAAGATVHEGGAFVTVEGPRFSTKAESNVFRKLGLSLIGMTASPEAFLAREAELCYGVMAHVTDYDVWHVSEEAVTVERVVRILHENTALAQKSLALLAASLPEERPCQCARALENAVLTQRDRIPAEILQRLSLLVGRHLR